MVGRVGSWVRTGEKDLFFSGDGREKKIEGRQETRREERTKI
jgi:hypothetical protein